MKRTRFLVLFLAISLLLTACGSAAPMDKFAGEMEVGYAQSLDALNRTDASPAETIAAQELKSESPELADVPTDRKLIKTVELTAETKHYDDLMSTLEARIAALGGYTESRQTGKRGRGSRWCSMTIRIPADKLGQFLTQMEEDANILSTSETTQDVTLQYSDTEAKITALETERARLLELMSQAQNLGELLEIEARLSDVNYELERYASRKRLYDNQITYATIHLSMNEVETLTPVEEPTVWEQIRTGFADSLQGVSEGFVNVFILLTTGSPYILVWGCILTLIVLLVKRLRRKRQKRKQCPPSETP